MVEDEDAVRGEKIQVGQAEFVPHGRRHGWFEVTDGVVGKVADAAAGKMGEALWCGEAGHFPFQFRQRVVSLAGADNPGALPDLEFGATGHEFTFRAGAKDGITSALFVLLGGLEKKGRLVLAGDFGESGHRCFAVRHQFGPDRHDAVLPGEGGELFGAGMNVGRRHAEQAGGSKSPGVRRAGSGKEKMKAG